MEISNVINVALLPEGKAVAPDNMNAVCLMTSEAPLNSNERYRVYRSISAIESDFGTYSNTYNFASVFFQQTPNPVNVGGALIIGYYRAVDESVPASSAILTGNQVNESQIISTLQTINNGTITIDIDGSEETHTSDFTTVATIDDIVTLLDGITGATCTYSDQRFVFTSGSTGVLSTLTVAYDNDTGTFIGAFLGLTEGATVVQGADADTLLAETKVDAVSAVKSLVNFKGFCFIENTTDTDSEDLATWSQANAVLGYDVFNDASNLEVDNANPVWKIKIKSQNNYIMLYSNDRRLACGVMARQHTVNFAGADTANTLNLKEIKGVEAVDYSQTDYNKAMTVGLGVYTFFKSLPKLKMSGANGWADDTYNLIAFVDHIQTDVFNLLGTTATKIPQTDQGVDRIIDQCEKTTRQFVNVGVFAPGTWSSPDYFGNRDTFERNITQNGYYWLAGSLAEQSQADRQARKSPVIQGAVKNAGSIESVDIIINLNY